MMNGAQQIQFWVGNKLHIGTVVRDLGNNMWGVTHIMNPDQNTQPEFTVMHQGGKWVVAGQSTVRGTNGGISGQNGIPLSHLAYHNPPGESVGLGDIMYRESYQKMSNQPRPNQRAMRRIS